MNRALKVTTAAFATAVLVSIPMTGQAVVNVDPGAKTSAGKTIIGSGRNLPTLNPLAPWDIGSEAKDQVVAYYTDGTALRDRRDVTNSAKNWTRNWLKETCGSLELSVIKNCNAAAVFDIDDTLFSTYGVSSTNTPAFTYDPTRSSTAESTCALPTIRTTKKLFKDFQSWGMDIVLITGRYESERAATIKCLNAAGISGWKKLTMRQEGDKGLASTYKAKNRKAIEETGVKIGPSMGDQVSDMSYGYLGRGFLLPNLMFFIP